VEQPTAINRKDERRQTVDSQHAGCHETHGRLTRLPLGKASSTGEDYHAGRKQTQGTQTGLEERPCGHLRGWDRPELLMKAPFDTSGRMKRVRFFMEATISRFKTGLQEGIQMDPYTTENIMSYLSCYRVDFYKKDRIPISFFSVHNHCVPLFHYHFQVSVPWIDAAMECRE